jgi:hypothetical protein
VSLSDPKLPIAVEIVGWSPFEPGDADNASLPVVGLEYQFINKTDQRIEAVFSFNAANFMIVKPGDLFAETSDTGDAPNRIGSVPGGFLLEGSASEEEPWQQGFCAIWTDDPAVKVNHAWLRASSWSPDSLTLAWRDVERAACYAKPPISQGSSAPGASLFVPFELGGRQTKAISVRFAWYVPDSDLRTPGFIINKGHFSVLTEGHAQGKETYKPWYSSRFVSVQDLVAYWDDNYTDLRHRSSRFSQCLYSSTIPLEIMDAVTSNLAILKSPTVLRQTDGRLWAWEGSGDAHGSCDGSCTHVWNYAQALPHLFPELERSLRETEFGASQNEDGHQAYRSALPIRPRDHDDYATADGQLGGIIKVYRDWRISGDTDWLRCLWPKICASLDYCIRTWDPRHRGWIEEPHHNTYDIEFWGPDAMHASIYLVALKAAIAMGRALLGDVSLYEKLLRTGKQRTEAELFNGEYFLQKIEWKDLQSRFPGDGNSVAGKYSSESLAIVEKEGPKYQYGDGCLSDGILGEWFGRVCAIGSVLDPPKVQSHLQAVYRHNFKRDLSEHVNPQRSTFACAEEGGLLLCTWPRGPKLSLPFVYSNEVWTGVEYQVAAHLIMVGMVDQGLDIVRTCRARYAGHIRNPFDEYEAGHWYARSMSSYALLQAISGARYDAIEEVLYLTPALPGDFRCFISTATGYGVVGVRDGSPFLDVVAGDIPYKSIQYVSLPIAGASG